ncbi:MAG: hypothetical protein WDN76_03920 [Alphaproteobacteria bacterium]
MLDNTKKTLDTVGETYPDLAGAQLGEKTYISYAARDGEKIPAFVTWPPGGERKNLPMVVLPHGGPKRGTRPALIGSPSSSPRGATLFCSRNFEARLVLAGLGPMPDVGNGAA